MNAQTFPFKVGLQQRVLPFYRVPFFDELASRCPAGLGVFAGDARIGEHIESADHLDQAVHFRAVNQHLFPGPFYMLRQRNIIDWLEKWNPDLLVMEANARYLSTRTAMKWMHARGKQVIGWGLGAPQMSGGLVALRWLQRRMMLSQLDAVISYSRKGVQEYIQMGVPADRVFVAPNAATRAPVDLPKKAIDLSTKPLVIYVGRLQARKRLELLIQACAGMPKMLSPQLAIIGDGPERQKLEQLASEIFPHVTFTGNLTGDALNSWLNRAELFVLPGTGGLAVQQAMGAGLPVIVAEGDGTQADLLRLENGWQVIPGDLDDLTSKISLALADRPKLAQMGRESYQIVKNEVNIERMADVFIQAFNTVMPS